MNYSKILPPEELKDYVSYYWTIENHSLNKTLRIVADGSPGLIFQYAEEGSFYQNNKSIPDLFVFGQATTHAEITLGKSCTVGICFRPDALSTIFGFKADELTDDCQDLESLPLAKKLFLKEQLLYAATARERIRILSSFLLKQIEFNKHSGDKMISRILPFIIQSKGQVSVKELRTELQLSERSFERRFKQSVGITPKLFTRICNFQASLHAVVNKDEVSLTDIAFEHDYADQSHFIRTFKEFAGLSPLQYHKSSVNGLEGIADLAK